MIKLRNRKEKKRDNPKIKIFIDFFTFLFKFCLEKQFNIQKYIKIILLLLKNY
jgi:hypothetical protein